METKNIYHVSEEYEQQNALGKFNETQSHHDLLVSKEHDRLEKQAQRIRDRASERLEKDLAG
jgi:hypothetical protein